MNNEINIIDRAYLEVKTKWESYNSVNIKDAEIARKLGMTRSNVSLYHKKINSGEGMHTDTLKAICEYFGIYM